MYGSERNNNNTSITEEEEEWKLSEFFYHRRETRAPLLFSSGKARSLCKKQPNGSRDRTRCVGLGWCGVVWFSFSSSPFGGSRSCAAVRYCACRRGQRCTDTGPGAFVVRPGTRAGNDGWVVRGNGAVMDG